MLKAVVAYIKHIQQRSHEHQIAAYSAQMAYFFVLSVFPLLMFTFSILARLNIDYAYAAMDFQRYFPEDIGHLLVSSVERAIEVGSNSSWSLSGLVMLYSASRGVVALQRAINTAYGVASKKNFVIDKAYSMFYTLMFILLMVLSILMPSMGYKLFHFINQWFEIAISIEFIRFVALIRNLILAAVYVFIFGSIYMYLPSEKTSIRQTYKGALFAAFGSVVINVIFSTIVVKFTDYSVIYGSLSAIIAFMIWLYALGHIIVLGAEINAYEMRRGL